MVFFLLLSLSKLLSDVPPLFINTSKIPKKSMGMVKKYLIFVF